MCYIFVHLFLDGHLGNFYVLVIVNSTVMNIGMHVDRCFPSFEAVYHPASTYCLVLNLKNSEIYHDFLTQFLKKIPYCREIFANCP